MQKLLILGSFVFWFLGFSVLTVSAHLAGQPPFLKINSNFANIYSIPTISQTGILIPQDIAPEKYLVNQNLTFEIDWKVFAVSEAAIKATTFSWDHGDGSTSTGLTTTHTYSKPGTYIQKIYTTTPQFPSKQLLESTMLHILPYLEYRLPVPYIEVNASNSIYVNLTRSLRFTAPSVKSTNKIINYDWDFGDGTTDSGQIVDHTYPSNATPGGLSMVSVILRTTDTTGLIGDAYLMLYDISLQPQPTPLPALTSNPFPFLHILLLLLLTSFSILIIHGRLRKTK